MDLRVAAEDLAKLDLLENEKEIVERFNPESIHFHGGCICGKQSCEETATDWP